MKKLLFIAMMCLMSAFTLAQTKHVQFKGIPVDGTLSSFVSQLKNQGFTYLGEEDGVALLSGKFAGYSDCTIAVVSTKGTVWKVVVLFSETESWDAIVNQYNEFKQSFELKYNSKPQSVEELQDTYSRGGLVYIGFKDEKNVWGSAFQVPGGSVFLEILPSNSYGSLCLRISYQDAINTEIRKSATMEDI